MSKWRNCQYPMMASTPKQNVEEPAARPSRPSVKLTALDVPTMTKTASTIHPVAVRFQPGNENRVNERFAEVCTQLIAKTAKTTAITSCPTNLARLFSPRFRSLRIARKSSVKPSSDDATVTSTARIPERVKTTDVPMWPMAYPMTAAKTMTTPPIVGIPDLCWWVETYSLTW